MRSGFAVCPAREHAFEKRRSPFTSLPSTQIHISSIFQSMHFEKAVSNVFICYRLECEYQS
jgi:hypothetical protein